MFECVSILVKGGWKETWAVQRPVLAETPAPESRIVSLKPFKKIEKRPRQGPVFGFEMCKWRRDGLPYTDSSHWLWFIFPASGNLTPHFTPHKNQGYWGQFSVSFGLCWRGWGLVWQGLASQRAGLLDWLVETVGLFCNCPSTEPEIISMGSLFFISHWTVYILLSKNNT